MEFYTIVHKEGEGSKPAFKLNDNEPLGELASGITMDTFGLDNNETTDSAEHQFKEKLGLNVQIFRKMGNGWIQTISTDNWTLAEQMERARFHLNED